MLNPFIIICSNLVPLHSCSQKCVVQIRLFLRLAWPTAPLFSTRVISAKYKWLSCRNTPTYPTRLSLLKVYGRNTVPGHR